MPDERRAASHDCYQRKVFLVAGAPGAKVSWRVEAVRNDLWVQQRGAPIEVEKSEFERGAYQHPGLYGQPREKGTYYRPESRDGAQPGPGLASSAAPLGTEQASTE